MSLKTFSAFIYGHSISSSNQFIDFCEDGINEIAAMVEIGSYSISDFINAVSVALNNYGSQEYSVSLDRDTRKITISATANFDLFVTTGTHNAISAFTLMGFTSNRTGSNSYESDAASGYMYEPQFKLQKFVDFQDNVESIESSVNTSASGVVEVVSFGEAQFMECNITYATDITGQGAIKNNPSGVSALRSFMGYLIKKYPVEFLPDIDNPSVFTPCILEKTRASGKGTSFILYELYGRGLANYFETGDITFRKVN